MILYSICNNGNNLVVSSSVLVKRLNSNMNSDLELLIEIKDLHANCIEFISLNYKKECKLSTL